MNRRIDGRVLARALPRRALAGVFAVGAAVLLVAPRAEAHFILETPASWMSQDSLGLPEKLGPCGDEGGGTVTSTITALHPGETVTIVIDEVIFHPGHYRVAVASDRSMLPAEPTVTAGATPCGSVPVESPPVFPVLADGLLEHTSAFTAPQTIQVTLPTNLTCTKCTLQVIEFMSDHPLNNPGGCFYHHCADISIQAGADPDGSAGAGDLDSGISESPDAARTGTGSSGGATGSSGGSSSGGSSSGGAIGSSGSGSGGIGAADASSGANEQPPSASPGGCGISGPASGGGAVVGLGGFLLAGVIRRRRSGARRGRR